MTTPDVLLADARRFLEQDPDATTRAELAALIERAGSANAAASAELEARFAGRLRFGTAGLRAELGAGPTRMNRVVVQQAAAGIAEHLLKARTLPSVVVGYDGRTNSEVFARDVAEVAAGAGVRALLFPRPVPTPVLAAAVRHLAVSAGVMVTASHNPATDNGLKVYLGNADAGSQLVPPADAEIEAAIAAAATRDIRDAARSAEVETVPDEVIDEYVRRTAAIVPRPTAQPRVVYTALHGVGWDVLRRVLHAAGFEEPTVVSEQLEPDPAFPTVAFPNPEEPGTLDLALRLAADAGADLVLANDPDADRLAVALPGPGGHWQVLSGNEIGTLLGWSVATAAGASGTLASSLVSSPALAAIAEYAGLPHEETLTGFKWISRVPRLAFGYEEALGFLVDPEKVRDKDGISAALAFLSLVAALAADGRDVHDLQREIDEAVGAYASAQVAVRVDDLAEIERITAALRADPPATINGIAVSGIDDFAAGGTGFPPSDILRYRLGSSARVIVRPSGTEPKLKVYLDAWSEEGDAGARRTAATAAVAALEHGVRELLRR